MNGLATLALLLTPADTPAPVVTPVPIVVRVAPPPPAFTTYLIGGRLVVVPHGSPPPDVFAPVPLVMPSRVPQWCPPGG